MLLTTLLNTIPLTKFLLIEDSLKEKATPLVNYLIKTHRQRNFKIHYFVFEGVFDGKHSDGVVLQDCVSETLSYENLKKTINNVAHDDIIIIDSLSNAFIHYGYSQVYKILHELCGNKEIKQVIGIVHLDVLEETVKTTQILEHLSTCYLKIIPRTEISKPRIFYLYKKIGGKNVKQIEEFKFENGTLITEPIKKLDVKHLVQENIKATLPENLTTFRISLDDKEKESRDKLVLPYLPQNTATASGDSKIFYEFDNVDDWDEEDPDDDLEI